MTVKEGWRGRFFEDFAAGDIYPHPLGRTGGAPAWYRCSWGRRTAGRPPLRVDAQDVTCGSRLGCAWTGPAARPGDVESGLLALPVVVHRVAIAFVLRWTQQRHAALCRRFLLTTQPARQCWMTSGRPSGGG